MATVSYNIEKPSLMCKDVIGVKGICDTTYPYYLDTFGISLNKAAKLSDSATLTARGLISDAINLGREDVLSDLRVDGFKINGVQSTSKDQFITDTQTAGTYLKTISINCDIENIYISTIQVKANGNGNVRLSIIADGIETLVYDNNLDNETLVATIETEFNTDEVTIKIISDISLYGSTGGGVSALDYYTKCDEKLFLCKYWAYLVKAVMYKATAHILNSSLFSDRYNDLVVYKKDEIALRVAQLDSSFNLLSRENRINTKGLYQTEIEKINDKLKEIVKQSYCTCCFTCDTVISSQISIP
jgi:hypothetical protein